MKLDSFEKHEYNILKERFVSLNAEIITNRDAGTAVVLVPHKRARDYAMADMCDVAVSCCHPNDKFSKKRGKYYAMLNYANGNFITIRRFPEEYWLECAERLAWAFSGRYPEDSAE